MKSIAEFRAEYAKLSDEELGRMLLKAIAFADAQLLPSGAALRASIERGELRTVDAKAVAERLVAEAHERDVARGETGRGGMEFDLYDGGLLLVLEMLEGRAR